MVLAFVAKKPVVALLMLVLAIAAGPVCAAPDWNCLGDALEGGIGLHAGWIGGTGLSFKYPVKWWLQLQVAGGIWNTKQRHRNNVGFEVQYLLRQDPRLRLYLLSGVARYSSKRLQNPDDGDEYWDPRIVAWNTGFGVGIEYLIGARWSFKVDVSYTYRDDKETLVPLPQVGLFYYW